MMRTLLLFAAVASVLPAVDYQREVRPILSDNCFQCHGPDAGTRMAGLRLDQNDSLVGKRAAILARVTETRAQRIMPPPSSLDDLGNWVRQAPRRPD